MKISKETIGYFVACGKQYHDYALSCVYKSFQYDFDKDELIKTNWRLYYKDMHEMLGDEFGELLYSLIEYARKNNLTIDNIANALRALNVEVEE